MNSLFPEDPEFPPVPESENTAQVERAMALLWTYQTRTTILNLLRELGCRRADGRAYTADHVKEALQSLRRKGSLVDWPNREGYQRLRDDLRNKSYAELAKKAGFGTMRGALHRVLGFRFDDKSYYWPFYEVAPTVAVLRLELLAGAPPEKLARMKSAISRMHDWEGVLHEAIIKGFDPESFSRITPSWRWDLAYHAVVLLCSYWELSYFEIADWALSQRVLHASEMPEHLHLALAEMLLHRGEREAAGTILEGRQSGAAKALRAYSLAQQGSWLDAQSVFEAAIKLRQEEINAKKRLFPESISWIYPLTLLAQQTTNHLEMARKFCLGESGKRSPDPRSEWGRWVHAIGVRLGDAELDRNAFYPERTYGFEAFCRLLIAAWLGKEAFGSARSVSALIENAGVLRDRLAACRFEWLASQVDAAASILGGGEPPSGFFISGRGEKWREVLSALKALAEEDSRGASGKEESGRILWEIHIGKEGELQDIVPLEQKRGARGWSKPKPLSLARLAGNSRLQPWDAKMAQTLRPETGRSRRYILDRAAAIGALIGHPAVVLSSRPEQIVELAMGTPEVEVQRKGDEILLKVTPPLRSEPEKNNQYFLSAEEKKEADSLRMITVIEDSPQRVLVFNMTPAQRRAAQLLSGKFSVPAAEEEELAETLQALSGHFQVHADLAAAACEIPAESRLRAELSPLGEGLLLRLVAAPLGPEGPRLQPGRGKRRLLAKVKNEACGTSRDLDAEKRNLAEALEGLPGIEENASCEWEIPEPEEALAAVETLPKIPAVAALDWPKGKPVRVHTLDIPGLSAKVSSEKDWFQLRGGARVEEGRVLDFAELIEAASSRSRFLPMGNGVYVALTNTLQERLRDLAKIAEGDRQGLRLPRLAAAWMLETLQGMDLDADSGFRTAVEKLSAAQQIRPPLPRMLQAELRPYQEDGYLWAMRLSSAGLGGCLADDMGLGKTLQALAVLAARAEGGPALVIAPTSVCGNWLAEAARFTPSLRVSLFGEGDREAVIAQAAGFDVVVVSYTLLQQSGERFAAKKWFTVVADEAQAIKNAAAKRSQAVFELDADFRLALSGTPVENRLSELWSIMRYANPGLLGTLPKFNERFAVPIERDRNREAQHQLRRLISPFLLRRSKAEVLRDLPARAELVVEIEAGKEEAAHYEAARRLAVLEADQAAESSPAGQARMNILASLTRLRRAACDPRLVTPEIAFGGAKVEKFAELAGELVANGHKALVFSQFVDFLTLLRQPLDTAGISYQYLDGSTPAAERTRRVAAFQAGEGDLFLISLKAGGFGLNLTAADFVFITDPWWNPAAEDQAMGRAHRIGQQRPVTVYRLVTRGTVEERIVALHQEKRALAESVVGEGDVVNLPSTEELIALIRGS